MKHLTALYWQNHYRLLLSVLNPTLTPRAITEVVTKSDSEK